MFTSSFLQRSCTCRVYDVEKIPCEHAIKAADSRKMDLAILVDTSFSRGHLMAAYAEAINPVDEDSTPPEEVRMRLCLPPPLKKQKGRPKLKRYISAVEKAKRYRRKQMRKRKQETNPTTPCPATKKRCRIASPSTPSSNKKTEHCQRTPSPIMKQKASKNKKNTKRSQVSTTPKMTPKIAPTTPTPTPKTRKRLFLGTPTTPTKAPVMTLRSQSTMQKKRPRVCSK